jgi:hypothetical protein
VCEELDKWSAGVGRPEGDGAVLVTGVEDGVVGVLGEGCGLAEVGWNFRNELAC